MGNCSLSKGLSGCNESSLNNNKKKMIRVVTDCGMILNFESPKLAGEVTTDDFKGYSIFKRGQPTTPLDSSETLLSSEFYYLVQQHTAQPKSSSAGLASSAGVGVVRHNGNGVWKVKLSIGTKELDEILAEDLNLEALVNRIRLAAAANKPSQKNNKANPRKMKTRFNGASSHC